MPHVGSTTTCSVKIYHLQIASLLLALSAFSGAAATDAGPTWPQWRGPGRGRPLSMPAWSRKSHADRLQRIGRAELGPSYPGPSVSGDRVCTTETKDKKSEVVTAFDRLTGRQIWRVQWEGAMSVPFFARSNGDWIRSTPALDGDRLYVAGMRDMLVCLDAGNGNEVWRRDFAKELGTPLPDFGFVCSPLVDGEAVYVQAGGSIAKLDKRDGKILWRSLQDKGGMMGSAFASPMMAELAGHRQLVVQTREKLAGLEPADGKVLWEQPVEAFRGMNILTPVAHADTLFTSTYGGKTLGFKVTRSDGRFVVAEAWKNKSQGYMSTPVVIDGVAYEHLKSQRIMAIEVGTGRELWTSDRSFGKYWSLIAQGRRVLALDQRGVLYRFDADRQRFDLLDERKVSDSETWAHLAVAGDQLFIRGLDSLTAWRWTDARRPAGTIPAK